MAPLWRHESCTGACSKIRLQILGLFWVKVPQEKSEEKNKNVSQSCCPQISKCSVFPEEQPPEKQKTETRLK